MNKKKICSAITAAACFSGVLAAMPELVAPTYAAQIVSNNFEQTYEGWHGTTDEFQIKAVDGAGFENSRGMAVTGRTTPADGAASSKGLWLEGGINYTYNLKVFANTNETFHLSLLYKDMETDEETTVELVNKDVKAGEWTDLSTSFKAPENTYEYLLTLTTDSTNDFWFDDVLITQKKKFGNANAAPAGKGLKDEFASYFRVGNILNGNTIRNSTITAIILKDHNAIECENETKPNDTIVQNGSTDTNVKVSLNSCAAICDFAQKNGLGFRGHTLVWHSQTPNWFFKQGFNNNGATVSTSVMDQRMESYIQNMFNAFATQYPSLDLYAYDVCNEIIDDGTASQGGVRSNSPWVQVYGNNSFVEKAFTYARKYAPKTCKLFYNDYNEFAPAKQSCIIDTILTPLKAKGLIDGMGMQSHLNCAATGAWGNTQDYLKAMDKYLNLGLEVQVTELDLAREGNTYSESQQSEKYKAIFQHCMDWNVNHPDGPNVTLVQVWGVNDDTSWVRYKDNNQAIPNYPLLYNGSNQPKAPYTELTKMIPDSDWGEGLPYTGPGSNGYVYTPPKPVEPDENGYYFRHTFENGTNDWTGRGAAGVKQSSKASQQGSNSLYCSGRTATWNGAEYALPSNAFKAGTAYSFSAYAMTEDGGSTSNFKLTLQYDDASGKTDYKEIATAEASKGEWVQLANKSYTLPEGSNFSIYVEIIDEDSLIDFYVDDVIGAVDGTVIGNGTTPRPTSSTTPSETSSAVSGLPAGALLGDANCDKNINIADAVLVMQVATNPDKYSVGKSSKSITEMGAINGDVDGIMGLTNRDALMIQKYKLGLISEFDSPYKGQTTTQTSSTTTTTSGNTKGIAAHQNNDYTYDANGTGFKDYMGQYFRLGTCVNAYNIQRQDVQEFIKKNFNSITCENEMKPSDICVQNQSSGDNIAISLQKADPILKFCEKNGIGLRGHTFVWYSQTPEWIFKENMQGNSGSFVSPERMNKRLESMIKNTFAALKTNYPNLKIYSYDVCNELFKNDGGGFRGDGGEYSNWWTCYHDDSFVINAFKYARKYAPEGCKLYMNDYNEYFVKKRDDLYNMAKKILAEGDYIDGIGMQSHMHAADFGKTGSATQSTDSKFGTYADAIDLFNSLGLDVQITELDVTNCADPKGASLFVDIFKVAMERGKNISSLTLWGHCDAASWRNDYEDGGKPLPFDASCQPKSFYNDIIALSGKIVPGHVEETTTPTTTTTSSSYTGDYMKTIQLQSNAPSGFDQKKGGVDYGTMEKVSYYSKAASGNKQMNVILPPGYNKNEKYPVLYVLHGIGGNEDSMPGMGIQAMLGNAIADGLCKKMIVVCPDMLTGPGNRFGFDQASMRSYDKVREDIIESIMPYMEEHYSIKTGRENTAISGFSLGGREALYTGVTKSAYFGYIGGACPAPGIFATTDKYMTHEGSLKSESEFVPSPKPFMLFISSGGDTDGVVTGYPEAYDKALTNNGVEHLFQHIVGGGHDNSTVTPHFYNFLKYVFKAA